MTTNSFDLGAIISAGSNYIDKKLAGKSTIEGEDLELVKCIIKGITYAADNVIEIEST